MRRLLGWIALLVGIVALWLAAWIYLPAPTYFLLTFSVGAPEVSQWTILIAIVGAATALVAGRRANVARYALGLNLAAVLLVCSLWSRVPGTLARFETATRGHMSVPSNISRTKPIVFVDLFGGVPTGPSRLSRNVVIDVVDGQRLTADIYAPPRHGLFPVVVQIYGGAWQRGTPSNNADFARWLASNGYVVIAIDYRHARRYRWPAQIDDVDDALRWVVAHATDFDGDTSRVALIGRSAGAHLATYAAWITAPIHLRGVISLYGPADLVQPYENPPKPDPIGVRAVENALIGAPLSMEPGKYADASTVTHLPSRLRVLPPTLLINGGKDHIVEAKYSRSLVASLNASGAETTYLEIPWADHAFDEVFNGPSSQIALYYIERFLAHVMA